MSGTSDPIDPYLSWWSFWQASRFSFVHGPAPAAHWDEFPAAYWDAPLDALQDVLPDVTPVLATPRCSCGAQYRPAEYSRGPRQEASCGRSPADSSTPAEAYGRPEARVRRAARLAAARSVPHA